MIEFHKGLTDASSMFLIGTLGTFIAGNGVEYFTALRTHQASLDATPRVIAPDPAINQQLTATVNVMSEQFKQINSALAVILNGQGRN